MAVGLIVQARRMRAVLLRLIVRGRGGIRRGA